MNNTNTIEQLANGFYTVLFSGGFSAVLSLGLIYLARNFIGERLKGAIQNEYNEKLESHKAQLQATNNAELEKLKAQLQIAASERSIKLTEIFTRQANVVVETYSYIVTTEDFIELAQGLLRYLNEETHKHLSQLAEINKKAHDAFQKSFKINKIYLPRQTAEQMDDYLATVSELLSKSSLIAGLTPMARANNWDAQIGELKTEVEQLEKNIPILLQKLEDDFQRILGFSMPEEMKIP